MFNFKKYVDEFNASKDRIADEMADEAVKFFLGEFDEQQWTDETTEPWQELADSTIKRKKGPAPLVETGQLREDLENSKKNAKWGTGLDFEVDTPYAGYHNDGGEVEGRPPQRQFIGESYELDNILEDKLLEELKKIFD